MAKLMLIGKVAHVEITQDEENECWLATCRLHKGKAVRGNFCNWSEHYYTLSDTTEYASDHADQGMG